MASRLSKDLAEAARRFGETNPEFLKSWQEIQERRSWQVTAGRTPNDPVSDWTKIRPPYGDGYAGQVCRALAGGPLPELSKGLWSLAEKLAELNRDFAPDTVDRLLAMGTCDHCKELATEHS